jgi:hypothetical protein
MVIGFAFSSLTGLFESAISTVAAPVLELGRQEVAKQLPVNLLNPQQLVENFRRGEMTEEVFREQLLRHGINTENQDRLLFASKFFPGAADLVRFVVKEAFSPEIVADLTKGEPVPQGFIDEMLKLGATEEIAEWFWTAHYDPLGRRDFEEMFQRLHPDMLKFREADLKDFGFSAEDIGVDQDFMKRMYRILDIYPGLRDRLLLIQYSKIPRIDIRRFEDFDILDDDELEFRNREDGRSPNDARKMVLFTKLSNRMKDLRIELRERLLTFDEAVEELIVLGAKPEAAKRLVLRIKPGAIRFRAQKLVNKAVDEILKSVANGEIDLEIAQKGLENLGLTEKEATAEIELAFVVRAGDFRFNDEVIAVVDDVRAAAELAARPIAGDKGIIDGFKYVLELQDKTNSHVDRILQTKHNVEDTILDAVTGLNAKVITRRQINGVKLKI